MKRQDGKATHYSGGLVYNVRDGVVTMLPGFPACTTGNRAWKVVALGNHAKDRAKVTCRKCLELIRRSDERKRDDGGKADSANERQAGQPTDGPGGEGAAQVHDAVPLADGGAGGDGP